MKRGQIHVSTIVIIIIALIVLVVVAAFFTGAAGKLFERIMAVFAGAKGMELSTAIALCNIYNEVTFCTYKFPVEGYGNVTCKQLGEKVKWKNFATNRSAWCKEEKEK